MSRFCDSHGDRLSVVQFNVVTLYTHVEVDCDLNRYCYTRPDPLIHMEILSVIQFSVLLYTHTSKSCDSLGDRLPVIQFSVVRLYTYTSKSSDAGGGQLSVI